MPRPTFEEIQAERKILFASMSHYNEVQPSWTIIKRQGSRIRTKILRVLVPHIEGKFSWTKSRICFEKESDALIYRMMFPGKR